MTQPAANVIPALADLFLRGPALVLSGAGISTDSGIPDYRSPASLRRGGKPMMYQEFVGSEAARQRYWTRSFRGWQAVTHAEPNAAHHSVVRLEELGLVHGVITQNVDGLHQAAGSRNVVELHGRLSLVRCLSCKNTELRSDLQYRLQQLNPHADQDFGAFAPDGDADIPAAAVASFKVAACLVCGGILKPDVVFFGENVPHGQLELAWALFDKASILLVLGSSLTVSSGYRFVDRALLEGKPVAIINRGPTEADGQASVRLDGALGVLLPELLQELELRSAA